MPEDAQPPALDDVCKVRDVGDDDVGHFLELLARRRAEDADEAAAPGVARRPQPGDRVLDDEAVGGVDAEAARSLEPRVGPRLAALDVARA